MLSGTILALGPTAPFAFRGPMNLALWASINTALTVTNASLAATVTSATGLAAGDSINSVKVPPGTTIGVISSTNVTLALPPRCYPASGFSLTNNTVTLPPGSNVNALLGAAVTSASPDVTIPANTTVTAIIRADVAPSLNSPGISGIIQLSADPTAIPTDPNPRPLNFAPTANAITAASGADAAATFAGAGIAWVGTVQLERSFDGGSTFLPMGYGPIGATAASWTAGPVNFVCLGEPEKQTLYRLNCTAYSSGTINYRISQTGGAAESLAIGPLTGG